MTIMNRQVIPYLVVARPEEIEEWKAETIALLEALAEQSLHGKEVSLPEKCAIALRDILGQRACARLAQYLQAT